MAGQELPDPSGPLGDDDVDVDAVREQIVDHYRDDPVAFAEDPTDRFGALGGGLGLTLADTQRRVLNAVRDGERQILVMSGNKTGKTAVATILGEWHYQTRYNSFSMLTSGNYDILKDSSWRFLKTLHKRALQAGWHGESKESPPRIEHPEYDEWFLRYMSPRDPKNLEGRHGRENLVVIEEADKPDVTEAHFESAGSTATEVSDITIALANPPEDKGNVVYDLLENPAWHTIQFSSFESHNVKRELGEIEDDRGKIPGLATLGLIKKRWQEWNRREWPGVETARQTHPAYHGPNSEKWTNLDPRWYRRMLGRMPPGGASTLRPFYERHVEDAVDRWHDALDDPDQSKFVRDGIGMDVARGGGDRTVIVERRVDGVLNVVAAQSNVTDHFEDADQPDGAVTNEGLLRDALDRGPNKGWLWIDAIGEGSAFADWAGKQFSGAKRFEGSTDPDQDRFIDEGADYYDWRTWAMVQLGNALKDYAVVPPGSGIERELREAARVLELEERNLRGGDVFRLKGKEELKEVSRLGRSPDILDAAALACFVPRERTDYQSVDVGGIVS